jgi:hypothetical protein
MGRRNKKDCKGCYNDKKNKMKPTPVEWLSNQLPTIDWNDPFYKSKLEQAKSMENVHVIHFSKDEEKQTMSKMYVKWIRSGSKLSFNEWIMQ